MVRSLVVLLLIVPLSAFAQASLNCPMRPKTLDAMLHCYRPLLVFSPSATDPRLREQTKLLDAAADSMMDRFVLLTPIVPNPKQYAKPLDTLYIVLSEHEMQAVRVRFHVPSNRFEVLLLNEEGDVAMRSAEPIHVTPMDRLIDTWPRRKREELRRDSY